jgi:hypothetical protein
LLRGSGLSLAQSGSSGVYADRPGGVRTTA